MTWMLTDADAVPPLPSFDGDGHRHRAFLLRRRPQRLPLASGSRACPAASSSVGQRIAVGIARVGGDRRRPADFHRARIALRLHRGGRF